MGHSGAMHGLSPTDPGRIIDWGRTAADYGEFRGLPASFYARLRALEVGLSGQRVLDLGTGTGVVARQLARQGCQVSGLDISPEQVAMAASLAARDGLEIDLRVGSAEETPYPGGSFDVITANQCWLYFDRDRAVAEARRILGPGGTLVTSHFCWLPRRDPLAAATERLVLTFNPQWTAGDWSGEVPAAPAWLGTDLTVRGMFFYDEPIPFTRETWRGRIRACRGIGACLPPDDVSRFDQALDRLLQEQAPESFTVLHRIDAHLMVFRE